MKNKQTSAKKSYEKTVSLILLITAIIFMSGCSGGLTNAPKNITSKKALQYHIGPGDQLEIFVWRNNELSVEVPVRPDGRISTPLVEDIQAAGKTPSQLARSMEKVLSKYIRSPVVTVIVKSFAGEYGQLVRVIGEAGAPKSIPYRSGMTLLDVMIAVGGLTDSAAGNRAAIIRRAGKNESQFSLRLDDLIRDGDISANVQVAPGDTIIIPESWL